MKSAGAVAGWLAFCYGVEALAVIQPVIVALILWGLVGAVFVVVRACG